MSTIGQSERTTQNRVIALLRNGVSVKTVAEKLTETVHVIDWETPEKNDFAIAEEVTLKGGHERRIDMML
jgi:type I restriction enzyme, R subunit